MKKKGNSSQNPSFRARPRLILKRNIGVLVQMSEGSLQAWRWQGRRRAGRSLRRRVRR